MTVSAASLPAWRDSAPERAPDRDANPPGALPGFGELLEALVMTRPGVRDPGARREAGNGALGDLPERFQAAPLLAARRAPPVGQTAEPQTLAAMQPEPTTSGNAPPRPRFASVAIGRSLPAASETYALQMQPAAAVMGPLTAAPASPLSVPAHTHVGQVAAALALPPRAPALPPVAGEPEQANSPDPAAPDPASGSMSRFGLHLLAGEHGPVLVMRLPKLTAEEREQLEAQIGRLFEAFGLRKHRLVLREMAAG